MTCRPHFLPGNRIGFSSTRQRLTAEQLLDDGRGDIYAGLEEDRQLPALNLHSIDARQPVADQISQLTFNPSHDTDPAVTADGWIVFTRWDNAPANGNSGRHLYRVAPSGRQTTLLFGYNSHDSGSDGGRVEFLAAKPLPDGRLLTLVRPTESRFYGGSLRLIDSANYVDDLQPLLQTETPAMAAQLPLTTTEIRTDDALSPGGRFAAAAPLYDGSNRVLVSWSQCRLQREDETILPCSLATAAERELLSQAPPLYGIWVYAIDDNTQQPVLLPREGFWYSDLVALENRSNPALVGDRIELLPDRGCASGSATGAANYSCELAAEERGLILIDSVYDVDGVADTDGSLDGNNTTPTISIADRANPGLGSNGYGDRPARFLRLVRPVPLPDDDIKSVDNFAFGLNRSQLMREIVGYAPIEPDGSVAIQAPANTALMLSIVDSNLQRISPRHNVWLSLGAGEILHCTGCHSNNSEQVHGRRDNQPASINPGAQLLGSGSLGFANTDTARWFAPREGASMAASWLYISTEFDLQLPGRPLQLEPEYSDEWAVNPAQADPPLDLRYSADIAFAPGEQPNQNNAGGPLSRIVINYPDHIQPIWARERAGIEDSLGNPYLDANGEPIRNCLGCHAATSADGTPRIAAGQLDLTDTPSASNADYYRSYTELLSNRTELWINADDDSIVSRQYLCDVINTNPDGSQFITQELRDATINRTMSTTGARASRPFFECFIDGLNTGVDRCTTSNNVPAGCTPVIANGVVYQFPDPNDNSIPLVFDHSGLLSRGELRLLAEWLDIGAQYLNDPYHPLLAD